MNKLSYPHVNETVYHEELSNGLNVYILPKSDFQKTYATFSTRYGSIDNHFRVEGKEANRVPDGIAHFLEHKMFEEPTGDIFATFASQGASANAFTSFDRTAYLFSSTQNIEENVMTLINFVQNPYFTDENVEKEKGIIGQEIRMYQDNPDWRSYFGLIETMYEQHPIRIDIAGTVESIGRITKETLYECYNTFYHPTNMMLFIVGGVEPERIMTAIRNNQNGKSFPTQGPIERIFEQEPTRVHVPLKLTKLPVSLPKCLFGFKENQINTDAAGILRQEMLMKLVLDILFSPSSTIYRRLYDESLITDSFGHEFNSSDKYAFSVLGGETPDPDRLLERVREELQPYIEQGVTKESFERSRRKKIGGFLRMLNSPEGIANEFTKYRFRGVNLFDILPVYESIKLDEVNESLKRHFQWEQLAVSIVRSEK
jgi:predicted Zn-dependent peptidase